MGTKLGRLGTSLLGALKAAFLLGASWRRLDAIRDWGPSWSHLGPISGPCSAFHGRLGASWCRLVLEPSWCRLGAPCVAWMGG